jgi:hypothetical protein
MIALYTLKDGTTFITNHQCFLVFAEIAETESSQSHIAFSLLDDPKTDIPDFETGHGWIYTSFLWKQQFYDVFFVSGCNNMITSVQVCYIVHADSISYHQGMIRLSISWLHILVILRTI